MDTKTFSIFDQLKNNTNDEKTIDDRINELKRAELLNKLREKKLNARFSHERKSKKEIKNIESIIKNEAVSPIITENIMKLYLVLREKNIKKLYRPSEILQLNKKKDLQNTYEVNSEIIELYYSALIKYNNRSLPLPNQIRDDFDKYKKEHDEFMTILVDNIKKLPQNRKFKEFNDLTNDPYCNYMSKCLNVTLDPSELMLR